MRVVKMHGCGNDFCVIPYEPNKDYKELAIKMCNRKTGIGADGMIVVKSEPLEMLFYNQDGSMAPMCGNGIRCFADFVYRKKILEAESMTVETKSGIKTIDITLENNEPKFFRVNMGTSTFKTDEVPMIYDSEECVNKELEVGGEKFNITVLSVGNPHVIIFVDDVDSVDIDKFGPLFETHRLFPENINVHFVEVISKNEGKMRTWERGAGVTLACGTGATSTAIAGYKNDLFDSNVLLHLPGGNLKFTVYKEGNQLGAFMEGPAELVFDGEIQ